MDIHQKLAWRDFSIAFPTEEHCLEELILKMQEDGWVFHCRKCNSLDISRKWGERMYKCFNCGNRGWILAGSFFGFIRKARLWLGCIWLLERGVYFNAWQLHKLAKCAYSTALMIFRKLSFVLNENMQENLPEVDSEEFISIFWKRSNQTPVGEHPMAEQDAFKMEETLDQNAGTDDQIDQINQINQNNQIDQISKLSEEQKQIYEFIGDEKIHVDDICREFDFGIGKILCELTFLESYELLQRHGGDYYTRSNLQISRNTNKLMVECSQVSPKSQCGIDEFLDYIRGTIHGISRKYLQLYLASFWCKFDRQRWGKGLLLQACIRSPFRSSSEIFEYITPAIVFVA